MTQALCEATARRREASEEALVPGAALAERGLLRFITCGSVDDGKSTLIGRLLLEAGLVPDDQLAEAERESKRYGTLGGALDPALLVDGLAAEREQGITIDVAYRYFSTPRRAFIVADTPGHEQYTRNMATGASSAELAIILVDARKGLLPQTRRHSFIVALSGIRHVVVAVNKMDLVDFDRATFQRLEAEYRGLVRDLGFAGITVIPVSARRGDNVVARSSAMPWYRGPALLDFLETVETEAAAGERPGFLLPVQWVNRAGAEFRGYSGTVAAGRLAPGDEVVVLPAGRRSRIERIVTADGDLAAAGGGEAVTVTLADELDISRGDLLADPAQAPQPRHEASARLLWTGEASRLRPGDRYLLLLGTAEAEATVTRLDAALDLESFEPQAAAGLAMNEIGWVGLRFDRPLVATRFDDCRTLGSFILVDRASNETVALGFVDDAGEAPEQEAEATAPAALAGQRPRLVDASWHLTSALAVGLVTLAVTGSAPWGLAAAGADLALRPLLQRLHAGLAELLLAAAGREKAS
ncbi:sulfate adenylyltransferase subunit 1 [Tistlia consotensis]|uniref:Bifunctional enzyme NodQ n=1 Tax=Tistlia consotensis USBA 355 TaxID=560819 RepID=A0A1Y6CI46_9PROT|nr:GTP-binding protein [Tistlia consotensis]SMF67055.1 sulfate adenylyltransferase subunit 1 [Tistlia consotensis USBA 355]SNS00505.1 sulfate adenylyltransferase subunit 1 [Tistlia consotensis]